MVNPEDTPPSIDLKEYEPKQVDLTDEEATFLAAEFGKQISVVRLPGVACWQVNPNQWVGVIALPSGRTVRCHPKISVRNLFYLLHVALGFEWKFRDEIVRFDRLEHILEFIAAYFAGLVDERIRQGLYRTYVDVEENLPFVRGRIDFTQDIRQNYVLKHRKFCRYAEFTWDVPENQVIRQVAHMLATMGLRSKLTQRLGAIDATLSEVTPTNLPASAIDRFHYHRLNEDYRQLHALCRLFMSGESLSETVGTFSGRAFLIDMNKLFEAFVTRVLQNHSLPAIAVHPQKKLHLGEGNRIQIQPDVLIGSNRYLVALDVKNKRLNEGEFKNHDIYQVLAYCIATGAKAGVLVYPRDEFPHDEVIRVRGTDIDIHQVSIDLNLEWNEMEETECPRLAKRVFQLVPARVRVAA